ncbi:glycoside hydrolase family 2 TIM barrel-domain containing protein [Ferruginibacter sp.]
MLFVAVSVHAQRTVLPLNDAWQFSKDNYTVNAANAAVKWQAVNLPHTWNIDDVMDDVPGYYRGAGWYKKTINISAALKNKNLFLYFEGANQQTEVYVNGQKAGSHTGGYTAFCVPVSPFIKTGSNKAEIVVKVDNSFNENIPPLSADFTFYGGIYRCVNLIATSDVHFSLSDNASKGVYISTPSVSEKKAMAAVKGKFINTTSQKKNLKISSVVLDRSHKQVATISSVIAVNAKQEGSFSQQLNDVGTPHLWSPEDPYLYSVITTITDAATGIVLDEVKNPLGLRWFKFDAGQGFFLNGKSYKLIGTSRHQDYEGMGNAVSKKVSVEDVRFIKNAGSNFFRVAHYPQDPAVMDACDSIGLLTSVEIPVVNEITESANFYRNCMDMQVEMIRQNYNHPSVIIWCYMNEIFLKPHYTNDKDKQKTYFAAIAALARSLDSITRKEDPYRYTMIANHADFNRYQENGLTTIAMITGWNLYSGWYSAKQEDFPAFLDRHHEKLPNQPFMITEYGADADNRIRSMEPLRFDKSVEYTTQFHQFYITEIMKRPFVAGAVVWNLADFNSETRTESMPHINNKGLLTWDRVPKDPYFLYQASFLKTPFVKIASSGWENRAGVADSAGNFCVQPLQVASNLQVLSLKVNDKEIGNVNVRNYLATWNVPFVNGANRVEVSGYSNGKLYKDVMNIHFQLQPYNLDDKKTVFKQLNVLLGAKRYFTDSSKQLWIPDQPYRAGSWGCVGGKPFIIDNNGRLPYGTDKNILDTDDDPIYQTQLVGIKEYCFDVPAGKYELVLHFAELQGGVVRTPPYNLSDTGREEDNVKRIFNVNVNNVPFLEHFNIAKQYGAAKAITKRTVVNVVNNSGITVSFKAVEGEPVLNAIQLIRID